MPARKIAEPREPQPCRDPEHQIPSLMHYEPGLYEHECPSCGRKYRFRVEGATLALRELKPHSYRHRCTWCHVMNEDPNRCSSCGSNVTREEERWIDD